MNVLFKLLNFSNNLFVSITCVGLEKEYQYNSLNNIYKFLLSLFVNLLSDNLG